MKTKDIISKLQELDRSGELHVSGSDGAILFLEALPGYYDGPGHYLEDDKYIIDYISDKVRTCTQNRSSIR